ncbi:glycine cleavage system protein H [Gorillibacterium sp. CAU 1737]|uniref:glycine cleavage system protein H n=1 Tax=Gorillibacterium sp. CAU 1737 TaxID=3140362 RepID=UPI0032613338
MMTHTKRLYSEGHLWLEPEGNRAKLGLTDYLQHELGMIVFADLPRPGERLTKGEPFGSVESVKSVSELESPVSGLVLAVNPKVSDNPAVINLEPYEAWVLQVELSASEELAELSDEGTYKSRFPDPLEGDGAEA